MFFGNEKAIVAIRVKNLQLFKNVLDNCDENTKSFYHSFDNIKYNNCEISRFTNVGNTFFNINTADDYNLLKSIIEGNNSKILTLNKGDNIL